MISTQELVRSIYGAWRLARLDPGGMQAFDGTLAAFWRSFYAALLLAPAYAVLIANAESEAASSVSLGRLVVVESCAYVIGWTAFPLLMLYLSRMLGRETRYFAYITAYNWAQVIAMAAVLLGQFVILALLPRPAQMLVGMLILGFVLFYEWFIARTALSLSGLAAVVPVLVSNALTLFVQSVSQAMLRAPV